MLEHPLLTDLRGYIDGAFRGGGSSTFLVHDPATGAVLAELPLMGAAEAELAVDAAAARLETPPSLTQRRRWLQGIADALQREREALAQIITAENGKPLAEARGEVDYSAGFFADASRRVEALSLHELPSRPRGLRWQVHHRPAGVAGLITPWNFPLGMLAKKLSGALAAGCPSVVKPAEQTPLTTVALFALLHRLGLPAGQVNLLFGDAAAIGRVLCERPEVRVLSFTGSTSVGKLLAAQCAPHVKRLALELGGNAPFVVFEDADLDVTLKELMANKFRCAGQTCVCTNRVLVAEPIADAFAERVRAAVAQLRVGPGDQPGTDVGPLIDRRGFEKVVGIVADARDKGAQVLAGGDPAPQAGCFYPPTVVTGVTADMRCLQEEVFGPVVPISTFKDEAEALRAANDTVYGLAAYVFTQDPARAQRFAAGLHFGHVGLNTATGPTPEAPFGGMGQSGIGREGGLEGILEFVELQTVPLGPGL